MDFANAASNQQCPINSNKLINVGKLLVELLSFSYFSLNAENSKCGDLLNTKTFVTARLAFIKIFLIFVV